MVASKIHQFEYTSKDINNCKQKWLFFISKEKNKLTIENLEILEKETPTGCFGHPQTIITLVVGREISSLNIEGLSQTACSKDVSCGQFLADCLKDIVAKLMI